MRTLGNIFWLLILQGWITSVLVYITGMLLTLTVIGAPLGMGLMEYGKFLIWPFGNAMVSKSKTNPNQNKAWTAYSYLILILYLPIGIILWLLAIVQTLILVFTIIGIPGALVIAKSLGTIFNPINKQCVSVTVVEELDRRKAVEMLDKNSSGSVNV